MTGLLKNYLPAESQKSNKVIAQPSYYITMNIMSDGNNGSFNTGSPQSGPAVNSDNTGSQAGQPGNEGQGGSVDYENQYRELEQKLGKQGAELGEYRQFFQNISPLLEKLDQDPVLVQAILDGKIDQDLAQAVSEGRVTVGEAEQIQQAHQDVKKEMGNKKYESASPDQIERMVEERVQAMRQDFEEKTQLRDFEERTQNFIQNTQDFADYADEIDKWLDSHDVTDIEVAYYAVKGQMSEAAAAKKAEEEAGERAKEVAQNAAGGGVSAQYADDGTPMVDKLISGNRNPNVF